MTGIGAFRRGVVAAGVAVLLAACGGGGGGSAPVVTIPSGVRSTTPSAASDLRADLVDSQAPALVRALLTSANGALLDPIGGTDASPRAATGRSAMARLPTLAGGAALAWLQRLPDLRRRQALAVQQETLPCSISGSLNVVFDDADNDQQLSAGDSISFTGFACVEDFSLPAISGGFSMQVDAVQLDAAGDPEGLAVTGSFLDFSLEGYGSMNGSFQLWMLPVSATSTRLRISYLGTTVVDTQGTATYDFDVDGVADLVSGSLELGGGLGLAGQTYAVRSVSNIGYPAEGAPSSGVLDMTDAAGDRLRLLPRDALHFDLEFWPAGATQPSLTRTGLLWSDFGG